MVAITETGFTKDGMVTLEGYKKIVSNPRLRENGSTVLQAGTAVWRKIDSDLKTNYSDEISVEEGQIVQIGTNQGYNIIVIYRSPNQSKKGIKSLIEYVYKLEGECVIIGDLNMPDADWETGKVGGEGKNKNLKNRIEQEELIEALKSNDRIQFVTEPTRKTETTESLLDVILTPSHYKVDVTHMEPPEKCDHDWLRFEIITENELDSETKDEDKNTRIDYEKALKMAEEVDWDEEVIRNETQAENDTCESTCRVCKFGRIMRDIQRDSTIGMRNRKAVVTEIEKEIDRLREIIEDKKAEKHSPIQADRDAYKMLKNRMTKLCRKRGREKRRTLLNNIKKDGKALHKPLSDKEKPQVGAIKQGNKLVTDKKEIAEIIAKQVSKTYVESANKTKEAEREVTTGKTGSDDDIIESFETNEDEIRAAIKEMKNSGTKDPMGITTTIIKKLQTPLIPVITKLANMSFQQERVPNCVKEIDIVVIPKPGKDMRMPGNLRPLNITSILVKIWERTVKSKIYPWLEQKNFFTDTQYGFRKNRSTIGGLASIQNEIQSIINQRQKVRGQVIALDFEKCFDTLNFDKIVEECGKAGIRGRALKWLEDWLKNNKFKCKIQNVRSKARDVKSGSKQGSVLGPLLFLVFLESLLRLLPTGKCKITKNCEGPTCCNKNIRIFAFADDMTIIYRYKKGTKIKKEMQDILDICTKWSEETGLKFNVNKCEKITLGGKNKAKEDLILLGKPIKNQPKIKILGLYIQSNSINPLKINKIRAKYSSRTNYDRVRTYYRRATFGEMKILWSSYIEAKSLYACEAFSKASAKKTADGNYEITGKEDWLRMMDNQYKKAFSCKYPRKGTINTKWNAIPLLPSERAIARSLLQVILIQAGHGEKYGLIRDEFLPTNQISRNTRMNTKTLIERSLSSSDHHQKGLSVMDIQKELVEEYLKTNEDIVGCDEKSIKKDINTFIRNLNTEEKEIRLKILQGEFVHKDYRGIIYR